MAGQVADVGFTAVDLALGAFGWGAAAALCPLVGLVTGMTVYGGDEEKRNRETFAAICEQQRQANPKLVCEYKDNKG